MIAFTFSVGLFYFLFLVGRATLLISKSNLDLKVQQFLSPAIGLAVTILLIFTVSRAGISMRDGSIPIILAEIFLTLFILFKIRGLSRFQTKDALFGIIPFGVLTTAWPILKYGFNWVSYVNDDMNNYVLAARRFYNYGFFTKPNMEALNSGSDYSLVYYFFHVTQGVRPGSELFLAFTSRILNGDTLAIFMPTVVTLQIILISTTIGLAAASSYANNIRLLITGLFSLILPLFSLGYLYQLIGQIGGLVIGVAILAIWKTELENQVFRIRQLLLFALLLSSQFIWYPEYLPFVGISIFVSSLLNYKKNSQLEQKILIVGLLLVLTLQAYLLKSIFFMINQLRNANQQSGVEEVISNLFPFFLKPHGMPALFGLAPLNVWGSKVQEQLTILFSFLLIILIMVFAFQQKIRQEIYLISLLIQSLVLFYFILSKNGFAAFKLSMYIQPLLAITFANLTIFIISKFRNRTNRIFRVEKVFVGATFFGMLTMMTITSNYYSQASTGNKFGGFAEIPFISQAKLYKQIANLGTENEIRNTVLISNAVNLSQAKMEAYSIQNRPIIFPAFQYFANFYTPVSNSDSNLATNSIKLGKRFSNNSFEKINYVIRGSNQNFLLSSSPLEIVNFSNLKTKVKPWNYSIDSNIENLLIFIYSKKGPAYYTLDRDNVAIYQSEQDPMRPGSYMQSLGEHLLFQVVNPQADSRFVIRISSTLLPQQDRKLPPINLVGIDENKFPIVGRGSARVYLETPKPLKIGQEYYFQTDFKSKPRTFPVVQDLLSDLYNSKIRRDGRGITTFGQDISFVENVRYSNHLTKEIKLFPSDLENNELFYSGIYEDGWFSENSYAILNASSRDDLVVKGTVPLIGTDLSFITSGQLLIDGKVITTQELGVGDFDFTIRNKDLPKELSGNHRVEVKFSKLQRLPGADGRPVSAKIIFMGFTSSE